LVRSKDQREERARLHVSETLSIQVAMLRKVHQILETVRSKGHVKKEPDSIVRQVSIKERVSFEEKRKRNCGYR
jgi:hypothetical protein